MKKAATEKDSEEIDQSKITRASRESETTEKKGTGKDTDEEQTTITSRPTASKHTNVGASGKGKRNEITRKADASQASPTGTTGNKGERESGKPRETHNVAANGTVTPSDGKVAKRKRQQEKNDGPARATGLLR